MTRGRDDHGAGDPVAAARGVLRGRVLPWLARAIGPWTSGENPLSASQAAMSARMAAILFATL